MEDLSIPFIRGYFFALHEFPDTDNNGVETLVMLDFMLL